MRNVGLATRENPFVALCLVVVDVYRQRCVNGIGYLNDLLVAFAHVWGGFTSGGYGESDYPGHRMKGYLLVQESDAVPSYCSIFGTRTEVYTAGAGLEVNEDADPVKPALLDEMLHATPALVVHFCWIPFEGCSPTEYGSESIEAQW